MTMQPTFTFLSVSTFEPWDWTNPDTVGIGGSETSHIEMARRLALRGASVHSYAPTSFEGPEPGPGGVTWENWEKADFTRPGIWVIYRDPRQLDELPPDVPAWLVCQDVDYDAWTDERLARVNRVIALCDQHRKFLEWRHPSLRGRVHVSSNGVKAELVEETLAANLPRNPKRLLYPSSPDRGLMNLIPIFSRAREIDRALELHVCYGFDNIEKVVERERVKFGAAGPVTRRTEMMRQAIETPGVINHGRIPQPELARLWAQTGIWCHPSSFEETSCITCMDAQALGAVPLTNPVWAVGENVTHGVFLEGPPADYVTRGLYVLNLLDLAADAGKQERIRTEMMPDALRRFNWERFVDQWLGWANVDVEAETAAGSGAIAGAAAVEVLA